jgi:hypothetical protein
MKFSATLLLIMLTALLLFTLSREVGKLDKRVQRIEKILPK